MILTFFAQRRGAVLPPVVIGRTLIAAQAPLARVQAQAPSATLQAQSS